MTDEQIWERACWDHPVLARRDPTIDQPLFVVDEVLARHLASLTGDAHAGLRRGVHRAFDLALRHRMRVHSSSSLTPYKPPTVSCPVDGTPLRVRLAKSQAIVVDVVGRGGHLCGDEIVVESVLPDTLLEAAIGKRASDVMALPADVADGSRTVLSTHVRFARSTVLRLSPTPTSSVDYADLFGRPDRRHPRKRTPRYPVPWHRDA